MTPTMSQPTRHVKGIVQLDLIKYLRVYQRSNPLPGLSAEAEELLHSRVIVSSWYALAPFLELLAATDSLILKGDENAALELGASAGSQLLRSSYRAYIRDGEFAESVMAVRHLWGTHYDFGAVTAELQADQTSVVFTITGFEDVSMAHALMTAGWAIAAARVAGAASVAIEVLERPWKNARKAPGGARFRYRVRCDSC